MANVLRKIIPLILLLLLVVVLAFVGFVVYSIASDIAQKTSQNMEKNNVSFSKDGMKVGIKEMKNENYVDKTQSYLVKAWNYSTWPAYKSRFWNKQNNDQNGQQQSRPEARRGLSHGLSQTLSHHLSQHQHISVLLSQYENHELYARSNPQLVYPQYDETCPPSFGSSSSSALPSHFRSPSISSSLSPPALSTYSTFSDVSDAPSLRLQRASQSFLSPRASARLSSLSQSFSERFPATSQYVSQRYSSSSQYLSQRYSSSSLYLSQRVSSSSQYIQRRFPSSSQYFPQPLQSPSSSSAHDIPQLSSCSPQNISTMDLDTNPDANHPLSQDQDENSDHESNQLPHSTLCPRRIARFVSDTHDLLKQTHQSRQDSIDERCNFNSNGNNSCQESDEEEDPQPDTVNSGRRPRWKRTYLELAAKNITRLRDAQGRGVTI